MHPGRESKELALQHVGSIYSSDRASDRLSEPCPCGSAQIHRCQIGRWIKSQSLAIPTKSNSQSVQGQTIHGNTDFLFFLHQMVKRILNAKILANVKVVRPRNPSRAVKIRIMGVIRCISTSSRPVFPSEIGPGVAATIDAWRSPFHNANGGASPQPPEYFSHLVPGWSEPLPVIAAGNIHFPDTRVRLPRRVSKLSSSKRKSPPS